MERPKFTKAAGVLNQQAGSPDNGARSDRAATFRASAIGQRVSKLVGAVFPRSAGQAAPGQAGENRQDRSGSASGRNATVTLVLSAATALLLRAISGFRPGLVTVMSLVAAVYVIIALSSSPTAIGIDDLAPRESVPVASAPSSSPEPAPAAEPDTSAEPPQAIATPQDDVALAAVPLPSASSSPLPGAAQRNAPAEPSAAAQPDTPAEAPQAVFTPPAEVATATIPLPVASPPPPDLVQPDVPSEVSVTLAAPAVEVAAAILPAAAPLPSAIAAASPRLPATAAPLPVTPLAPEVLAAPAVAQPTAAPIPEPAVDGPAPAVSEAVPASPAAPATSVELTALPDDVATPPAEAASPPPLADIAADAPVPATPSPSVPDVAGIALSLPSLAVPPADERAAMSGPATSVRPQPRLAAIQGLALVPNAPDSTLDAAAAPPVPLAQPPQEEPAPRVSNTFANVFVRVAVPETVPEAEVGELVSLLQAVGLGDGRFSRVGFTVSETHIRYYREADAETAASLGEILGAEARDHTSFRPSPPEGTLEVFIAGGATSPPPRAASPGRAQPAPPEDDLTRMRNRILDRLRNGENF